MAPLTFRPGNLGVAIATPIVSPQWGVFLWSKTRSSGKIHLWFSRDFIIIVCLSKNHQPPVSKHIPPVKIILSRWPAWSLPRMHDVRYPAWVGCSSVLAASANWSKGGIETKSSCQVSKTKFYYALTCLTCMFCLFKAVWKFKLNETPETSTCLFDPFCTPFHWGFRTLGSGREPCKKAPASKWMASIIWRLSKIVVVPHTCPV